MRNRKFKNVTYIATLLMILALTLSAFCVFASADSIEPVEADDGYEVWRFEDDYATLRSSKKKYTYVWCNGFTINKNKVFVYENNVEFGDLEPVVYSNEENGDMVWLSGYANESVYLSDEGIEKLEAFLGGDIATYGISVKDRSTVRDDKFASVSKELADSLTGAKTTMNFVFSDLRSMEKYELVVGDRDGLFEKTSGVIFNTGSGYYFLDYADLDSSYFYADGSLSYSYRQIDLKVLFDDTKTAVEEAVGNAKPVSEVRTYERDIMDEYEYEDFPMPIFWIFLVFFGLLLPIPVLVLGLLLPRSKKLAGARYWRLLAWLAIAWMVAAALLILVLAL